MVVLLTLGVRWWFLRVPCTWPQTRDPSSGFFILSAMVTTPCTQLQGYTLSGVLVVWISTIRVMKDTRYRKLVIPSGSFIDCTPPTNRGRRPRGRAGYGEDEDHDAANNSLRPADVSRLHHVRGGPDFTTRPQEELHTPLVQMERIRGVLRQRYGSRPGLLSVLKNAAQTAPGYLFAADLQAVLEKLGLKCDLRECELLVQAVDRTEKGAMNFEEFADMVYAPIVAIGAGASDSKARHIAVRGGEVWRTFQGGRSGNCGGRHVYWVGFLGVVSTSCFFPKVFLSSSSWQKIQVARIRFRFDSPRE